MKMGGFFLNNNIFRDLLIFLIMCFIEFDWIGIYIVFVGIFIVIRIRYNVYVKVYLL